MSRRRKPAPLPEPVAAAPPKFWPRGGHLTKNRVRTVEENARAWDKKDKDARPPR